MQYLHYPQPPAQMMPMPPVLTEPSVSVPAPAAAPVPVIAKDDIPVKSYERRNKKRRPPDYYDRLAEREKQAEAASNVNGCDAAVTDSQVPVEIAVNSAPSVQATGPGPLPVDPPSVSFHEDIPAAPLVAEQPIVAPEDPLPTVPVVVPEEQPQVENMSVSSQIYSDASRTTSAVKEERAHEEEPKVNGVPSLPETEPVPSLQPAPRAPKVNSWAGLFSSSKSESTVIYDVPNGSSNAPAPKATTGAASADAKVITVSQDKEAKTLAGMQIIVLLLNRIPCALR
jgi:hypothetical protein